MPKSVAVEAEPEVAEIEERDTVCTNGPLTRNCWASGYSVATDFDTKWPTTGHTAVVSDHQTMIIQFLTHANLESSTTLK